MYVYLDKEIAKSSWLLRIDRLRQARYGAAAFIGSVAFARQQPRYGNRLTRTFTRLPRKETLPMRDIQQYLCRREPLQPIATITMASSQHSYVQEEAHILALIDWG